MELSGGAAPGENFGIDREHYEVAAREGLLKNRSLRSASPNAIAPLAKGVADNFKPNRSSQLSQLYGVNAKGFEAA